MTSLNNGEPRSSGVIPSHTKRNFAQRPEDNANAFLSSRTERRNLSDRFTTGRAEAASQCAEAILMATYSHSLSVTENAESTVSSAEIRASDSSGVFAPRVV